MYSLRKSGFGVPRTMGGGVHPQRLPSCLQGVHSIEA